MPEALKLKLIEVDHLRHSDDPKEQAQLGEAEIEYQAMLKAHQEHLREVLMKLSRTYSKGQSEKQTSDDQALENALAWLGTELSENEVDAITKNI